RLHERPHHDERAGTQGTLEEARGRALVRVPGRAASRPGPAGHGARVRGARLRRRHRAAARPSARGPPADPGGPGGPGPPRARGTGVTAGAVLANLIAYGTQVAVVVAAGAVLARVTRLRAPAVLLAWWRLLLLTAVILPL